MFAHLPSINHRTVRLLALLLLSVALPFTACKDSDNTMALPAPQTITQLLTSNGRFTLLTAALNRAGLTTTLSGTGPFTIFAPNDDAFRAAGFADAAAINAAPTTTLASLLQYHVVGGSAPASAIPAGQTARPTALTTNGTVYLSKASSTSGTTGTGVSVNGARVLQADVQASNGVVHVIDQVLMPPAATVLALAQADTSLSLLVALALRAGTPILDALDGASPVTVFAPTNDAFRAAGISDTMAIKTAQVKAVTTILTNHLVTNTRSYSPTFVNKATITSVGGGSLTVTVGTGSAFSVTSRGNRGTASTVITPDVNATNGVIHKIDRVLLP